MRACVCVLVYSSFQLFWCLFLFYEELVVHDPTLPAKLDVLLNILKTSTVCKTQRPHTYSLEPMPPSLYEKNDWEIVATIAHILPSHLHHVFKGAYVSLESDDGFFYAWILGRKNAYPRQCSHLSIAPVYGVPVFGQRHSMIGGVGIGNDTWFQLERDMWSWHHWGKSTRHALNFLYYILLNEQVGPFGTSHFTERRPLRLPTSEVVD